MKKIQLTIPKLTLIFIILNILLIGVISGLFIDYSLLDSQNATIKYQNTMIQEAFNQTQECINITRKLEK
jgi:hypothetical protein